MVETVGFHSKSFSKSRTDILHGNEPYACSIKSIPDHNVIVLHIATPLEQLALANITLFTGIPLSSDILNFKWSGVLSSKITSCVLSTVNVLGLQRRT